MPQSCCADSGDVFIDISDLAHVRRDQVAHMGVAAVADGHPRSLSHASELLRRLCGCFLFPAYECR